MTEIASSKESVSFDSIRLKVGDSMQMQPHGTADNTHYSVRYMGGLQGTSIITSVPVIDHQGMWMRPNGEYIFRILSGSHIYAFIARLIKARAHPYDYAHFTYPDKVDAKRIRRSPRISLNLDSTAMKTDGSEVAVTFLDLSLHGAQVEAASSIGVTGDKVSVILPIYLTEVNRKLTLSGHIRNVNPGDPARYGLEFDALSDDDRLLLHFFIDYQIAEGGQAPS